MCCVFSLCLVSCVVGCCVVGFAVVDVVLRTAFFCVSWLRFVGVKCFFVGLV